MLTTSQWGLDPASPEAGDPGPLTIRDVADAPIRWSVCVIPRKPEPSEAGRAIRPASRRGRHRRRPSDSDCAENPQHASGSGSMGATHGRMGCLLLAGGGTSARGGGGRASAGRGTVRFKRRPRTPYTVTDRKRAAARRLQQRQCNALPLLAELVAEQQPCIDRLIEDRVKAWGVSEQNTRDWHAQRWRQARRPLDAHDAQTRRALLDDWNGHRWLPADASYLLDMLDGFRRGRLVIVDGAVQPARVVISVAKTTAVGWDRKPVARGWRSSAI